MPTNTANRLGGQVYGDATERNEAARRALLTDVAQTGSHALERGRAGQVSLEALRGAATAGGLGPRATDLNRARIEDPMAQVEAAMAHERAAYEQQLAAQQSGLSGYFDQVAAALPIERSRAQSQAAMIYQEQIEQERIRQAALEQHAAALAREQRQSDLAERRFALEKEGVMRQRKEEDAHNLRLQAVDQDLTAYRNLLDSLPTRGGRLGQSMLRGPRSEIERQIADLERQRSLLTGAGRDEQEFIRGELENRLLEMQLQEQEGRIQQQMFAGAAAALGDDQILHDLAHQVATTRNPDLLSDLPRSEQEKVLEAVNTFTEEVARFQGERPPPKLTTKGVPARKERGVWDTLLGPLANARFGLPWG